MKNNIPEVGDVVVLNPDSHAEIRANNRISVLSLLRTYRVTRVTEVKRFEDYITLDLVDGKTGENCTSASIYLDGTPFSCSSRHYDQPFFLILHDKPQASADCYCHCGGPSITTGFITQYSVCTVCKKEKKKKDQWDHSGNIFPHHIEDI